MPFARDEAGNLWEVDAAGHPVRLVQPGGGAPRVVQAIPPNPAAVAAKQAEEARQAATDRREQQRLQIALAAEGRAAAKDARDEMAVTPPGDTTKTGDAYLATLPPALAGQVKALAEGRRAFPTGAALRSPQVMELVAAATQYDPTLDAANAATRVATRKKFTSGKARDNITAINTALGHLGSLSQAAEGLGNRDWRTWNTLGNALLTETGDERVKTFGIARDAVANELMRVFRGTGGSMTEIEEWKKAIDSSDSPAQLRSEIGKAVELLNSRLMAMGDEYEQGMNRSSDPLTFLNPHAREVFNALAPGGPGVYTGSKGGGGAPPSIGGGSPRIPGSLGPAPSAFDNGAGGAGVATGPTKRVPQEAANSALNALVQHQRPYAEAVAWAQQHGLPVPPAADYAKALQWQQTHPRSPYNASDVYQDVPTTVAQRLSATPEWAALGGAVDATTGGYNDELAGGLAALAGGDYTQARDAAQADKTVMSAMSPTATLLGNVAGGVGAALTGEAALARYAPGALAMVAGRLGRFAPAAGDATYGAIYGSGENNENRLLGAAEGAAVGVPAGAAARSATRGLANIVSPPAGTFGPAYERGVFPTIGQRFARSGLAGRILNTGEQAMQSVPVLGSMVARARQIPRDAYQTGAFDEALAEIGQQLPPGTGPGTDAHAFTSQAFGTAYNTARRGMQFLPDAPYLADEQAFNQALGNGTLDAAQAEQVRRRIETVVGSRLGSTPRRRANSTLQGEAYQNAASALDKTRRDWAKTDPLKAQALTDYLTIFDNAARRNSHPQAVAALDAADRGYARLVRVQNASSRGGVGKDDGTFTPNQLAAAVKQESGGIRSGPFLRGDALMQDYAEAGRGLSDTLPNSGTADRLYTGQALAGGTGAMFGAPAAIVAHPGSLAPFALYAPGVNRAVTRAIAPRSTTLPPQLAASLDAIALGINNRAGTIGRLAVPGALGWELGR